MEWDDIKDREALIAFKDNVDCDEIKVKEKIKSILLDNRYIIHALGNTDLEEVDASASEYFGESILPYYLIPTVQTNATAYLCYEVSYDEVNRYNKAVKVMDIIFYILCHKDKIIDTDTGITRHDLLSALIQDEFNYTNYIQGGKLRLVSNKAITTDNNYVVRTLIFQQITDNNNVKTRTTYDESGNQTTNSYLINKDHSLVKSLSDEQYQ